METLKTDGQFTRRKTWVQVIWKARGSNGENSCQTSKSLLPASHVKSSEPASRTTFLYKNVFSVAKSLSKSTSMASKEMYFAFGSNLNPERMKQRKAFFTARVGAKLLDHKFSFSFKRPDGTGAGNIRPQKSSVVYGALYTLEEGGLDKLDVFEWVDRGCYRRQNVTVETLDGERVEATTYVVTEDFYEEGLLPRRDYLNHCLACKDVVPTEYYAFLESFKEICHD